jgi:hypothetical protein
MDITFREPSPEALFRLENRGGKYVDFALALQEHQGKWAVLPEPETGPRTEKSAAAMAQSIRRGVVKGFTKGQYEAIYDAPDILVRWVGPPASDLEDPEDDTDPDDLVDPREVRAWAKANGHPVSTRGALGRELIEAYQAAHRGRPTLRGVSSS